MADADASQISDELTDAEVANALGYMFAGELQKDYQAERTVWGVPVVLRALDSTDTIAAEQASAVFTSPAAILHERSCQLLARAVVSVNGVPMPPALDDRLLEVHAWRVPLTAAVYDAWQEVLQEYSKLIREGSLKNS